MREGGRGDGGSGSWGRGAGPGGSTLPGPCGNEVEVEPGSVAVLPPAATRHVQGTVQQGCGEPRPTETPELRGGRPLLNRGARRRWPPAAELAPGGEALAWSRPQHASHPCLFFSLLAQGPPGKDGLYGPPGLPGPKVGILAGCAGLGAQNTDKREFRLSGALEELACKALDQDAECLGYKGRRGQVSFFLGSWGRVWEPWPLKSIC